MKEIRKDKESNLKELLDLSQIYSLIIYLIILIAFIYQGDKNLLIPKFIFISFILIGIKFIIGKNNIKNSHYYILVNSAQIAGILGLLFGLVTFFVSSFTYQRIWSDTIAFIGMILGLILGQIFGRYNQNENKNENENKNKNYGLGKKTISNNLISFDHSYALLHSESNQLKNLIRDKFNKEFDQIEINSFIKFSLLNYIYFEEKEGENIYFSPSLIKFKMGNDVFNKAIKEYLKKNKNR